MIFELFCVLLHQHLNANIFAQSLSNHHLEKMRAKEYTLGTCP